MDLVELITKIKELVEPIIKIVELVGDPIVRYLKHQINFNDYLKNFKESKEKLQRKQRDIGSTLRSQLVYGKKTKEEVDHWLEEVEEITGPVARDIEDKIEEGGWLLRASGSLAKLLEEKIQEMEGLCEDGSKLLESLVVDDPSTSTTELLTSELQGSGDVKAEILACLKGEKGEEVTKLGVWGMGGVGKTTIMMHVHNELLKEGKFKRVILVTVSQYFNICNLQEQIASSLNEKLEKHQSTINRASKLSKMLEEQKPYLLILDDVWSSFKLEDVGIPEPNVTNGCKLVLTTRSQEIARAMDCRRIQVKTLSAEEALKLFLNKVGDIALSCQGGIKTNLESTLKGIVDACDGLPLAIVTVAGSLKEISEPRLWSAALNQLQHCKRNVAGTDDDDAFKILKFSYDRLKNKKIQYCFLYCALYPEDYNIPKDEIIEYWIDEGFIDELETRHAMKDEGYHILRKLEENSLLELIEDEVRGDCVRMHDLIRDMALDITRMSPWFLVEAGKALKELPEQVEGVEKVSLMCNYIKEIPSSWAFSTCTRLTTLLVAYNKLSTIPESVFEHMPELKILDLSFNWWLNSLPNSVSKLVKLTTLLLESTSLERVPSLSGLVSLKKLNLRQTNIREVPEGLGMLKNLKCLFLCGSNEYSILEIDEIAGGVLSNLSKLQELSLDRSRIKVKGDVVGRLKKLEVFHGWFPTANEMRIFLKCQPNRLSDYFIAVGSKLATMTMTGYFDGKSRPRYKKVVVFKETSIVGDNMLFPSIQILGIVACHDMRSLNDFSTINDATDLRECWIKNCEGMECIFPSWINNPVVQTLEYLRLDELHKLDRLFEANIMVTSSPPPGTFSSLKEVDVTKCKKLKKLFPSWKLVEYLQSLEKIGVYRCEEMEEIIGSNPGEGGDIINKLILPKLKWLKLLQLPALKSICSRRVGMVCDSLETITIRDCKKVKQLFPSWKLVEYLQCLKEIDVSDCEEMEEIIASDPEEEGEGGDIIKKLILPKLKWLELSRLPTLKSICRRKVAMVCDSLQSISISDCKGLRRIPFRLPPRLSLKELDNLDWLFETELIVMSPPQPHTFSLLKEVEIRDCKKVKKLFPSWKLVEYLQSLEEIDVSDCEEMEDIIGSDPEEGGEGGDIIKKLILPKLKWLKLSQLPALKSICSKRVGMVCDSLEMITIRDCKKLKKSFPSWKLVEYLQSLEKIDVSNCEEMEEIIGSNLGEEGEGEGRDIIKKLILPKLKWLKLLQLPALKSICSRRVGMVCDSLETITIRDCKKVKKLFPSWKLVEYLQCLEEIDVSNCEEMEEIIASDLVEEGEGEDIIKKLILPKLKRLELSWLPTLKSICGKRVAMVCDSLQSISISDCKGLRRIPFRLPPRLSLKELDNLDWLFETELITMSPPQPCTFSLLKEVEIRDCNKVKKLFPSWKLVEYLQSLEEIDVSDCEEMEEIIGSDPEEGEEKGRDIKKLILPKLQDLTLMNLPALKSICSRRVVMVCDSLETITIWDCKGLRRMPLCLPLVDNAQPSAPPSLEQINLDSEWWESLEWDHPNAKDVLQPMVQF